MTRQRLFTLFIGACSDDGEARPYHTGVVGGPLHGTVQRYPDRAEALKGHEELVGRARASVPEEVPAPVPVAVAVAVPVPEPAPRPAQVPAVARAVPRPAPPRPPPEDEEDDEVPPPAPRKRAPDPDQPKVGDAVRLSSPRLERMYGPGKVVEVPSLGTVRVQHNGRGAPVSWRTEQVLVVERDRVGG